MSQKIILSVLLVVILSGCVVQPVLPKHKSKQVTVKTKIILDSEHQHPKVVIVTRQPNKGRKCWAHLQHWHCKKH